jgi:hypothetical protein
MDSTKLAQSLFEALANCDDDTVRKFCAPDSRASQNGGPAMDLETLLGFNTAVHKVDHGFSNHSHKLSWSAKADHPRLCKG